MLRAILSLRCTNDLPTLKEKASATPAIALRNLALSRK